MLVEEMFGNLRSILVVAGACKKPDQKPFSDLLGPLQANIEAVTRFKEANRKDRQWFDHLSVIAEGAPAVGWITVVSPFDPFRQCNKFISNVRSPNLDRT